MGIKAFEQVRTTATAIGIDTLSDLIAFYKREKRAGENLPATLARYAQAIDRAGECARARGCDSCELCCYNFVCDTYADILGE